VNLSLWRIKRCGEHAPGVINLPQIVPLLGAIATLTFVIMRVIELFGLL
jgi:hypothetical protein